MGTNLPSHVGLILDGNRRWAKSKGLPSLKGHSAGYNNFQDVAKYLLLDKKIPTVSAYVFSTENWNRTKDEVDYLMKLLTKALSDYQAELHEYNIKIVVLGSRDRLSKPVLKAVDKAESTTASNTNGTLALCLNYGGHQELADAVNKIIKSGVSADDVSPELIADNLYQPELPPVDFMIRTSGEQRTSGFMLWRTAYSELYFSDKYWPDFGRSDVDEALAEYANRQRRFGS